MASLFKPGADPDLSPELQAFYDDGKQVRRNVLWILVMTIGWNISFTVVGPLMTLHLNACGLNEGMFGTLGMINAVLYSYLVMYFSWKSDRTVTRFGRRIPYLFICVPGIVIATFLFPFFTTIWVLLVLSLMQMFFTDIKSATIPLLNIDCIPRKQMARMGALMTILGGLIGFFVMRYGMRLAEHADKIPFYLCAVVASVTSGIAAFRIKEPPVHIRAENETFKPWSAFKVGWADKREIFLMLGVGCITGFGNVFGGWSWLFAANVLKLTKADMGDALAWGILASMIIAYPVGWIVDRFGSYIIIGLYVLILTIGFAISLVMDSANWLAAGAIVMAIAGPLYGGIDLMVYRSAHPKDIGSITSSNSFLRGLIGGVISLSSGFLIKWSGGNYRLAFIEGYCFVLLSLVFFGVHYYLKNKKPSAVSEQGEGAQEPSLAV